MARKLKNPFSVFVGGTIGEYKDDNGNSLVVTIYSTGETAIIVNNQLVTLTNLAAHQLRDMFNKRFPNATEVQGAASDYIEA